MHKCLLFTAIGALICLGTVASAETLSGGPVYGGPSSAGGTVTCRVFNAGSGSLSLTTRQIFTNTGTAVTLSSDSCGVGIPPTQTCAYSAPITGNFAYSCRMFETSVDGNIRGVAEILSSGGVILNAVPLTR
jgi:hypothetical protein